METNRSTYFLPRPTRRDGNTYNPDLALFRNDGEQQAPQGRMKPPVVFIEDSKITKIRANLTNRRVLASLFPPKNIVEGVEIYHDIGYLVRVSEMRHGGAGIVRSLATKDIEIRIPLREPIDSGFSTFWQLFLLTYRAARHTDTKAIVRTGRIGAAAYVAEAAVDLIQFSSQFQDLYLATALSDAVTNEFLGGVQDTWTFDTGPHAPDHSKPILKVLIEELTVAMDDVHNEFLTTLRLQAIQLVETIPIGNILVGGPVARRLYRSIAARAQQVLEHISTFRANSRQLESTLDASAFYTSGVIQTLTAIMIDHLGVDLVVSVLYEGDRQLSLPNSILGLPATMVEVELEILKNLNKHAGIRMYPSATMNRFTSAEFLICLRHSSILSSIEVSRTSPNAKVISSALAVLEFEMDIDKICGHDLEDYEDE